MAAVPGLALIAIAGILVPLSIVLGLVPLALVVPALSWMDRVEPEPWSARVHAFLWGAFVAGGVSLIVNSILGVLAGETIAAVVSAPIIEESMKGPRHRVGGTSQPGRLDHGRPRLCRMGRARLRRPKAA